jgi:serine/threonine protein kinase/Tol biopolymer transport system component
MMTLEPGKNLGHYRLVEKIGEGGMGVVWKALDTSLDREVAIKILPDALSGDPTRLARFEREAKLLASLNHPGIAVIHGLHAGEGLHFLAMELIPGEDLSRRLARGPVPLNEALTMALQIAEALEAAHERGVIHRDLKPANILVTPEGSVKILDFGLAKALSADGANDTDMSMSPTMTSAGTVAGMILGTAAYMSPEQAHGRPVDRRADIWAFGVVLFELLAGKSTFRGESVSDTLASVLKLDPDWLLVSSAPPRLTALLRRCLNKDPRHRLQAIGEARIALEEIGDGSRAEPAMGHESAPGTPSGSRLMQLVPWSLAAIMAVVAAIMLWNGIASAPDASSAGATTRLHISLGSDDPGQGGLPLVNQGPALALSPDGQRVAYILTGAAGETLWVRELNSLKVHLLPETTGATAPFFSADGESIGFFAGGQLKRTPVAGGPVAVVAEARTGRGGTWCADGSIIFAPDVRSGLFRVSAEGGTPESLTTLDPDVAERSHRWPSCLADGSAVLFMVQYDGKDYDDGALEAVTLDSAERTTLHLGGAFPRALDDRHLLFARQGQLFHAPLDAAALTLTTRPTPVLDDLMSSTGNQAAGDGSAQFAVNNDGLLIYRMGWSATNSFPMIWVDRDGNAGEAFSQPGTYTGPRVSPDGRKVAYGTINGTKNHILVMDLDDGKITRLTFGDGSHYFPVWTWDSQYVLYSKDSDYFSNGMGGTGIFITRADGSEAPRLIYQGEPRDGRGLTGQRIAMINPSSISPDMRTLLMQGSTPEGGWDLSLLHLDADGKIESEESFAVTQFTELHGEFSPDGSLIVYQSNESGINQIYVRPYPDTGGRWQISTGGGAYPRWSGDGTELFFRAGQAVMTVTVGRREETGRPDFGKPGELFQGTFLDLSPFSAYDPAPDGQRFVMFPGPSTDAGNGSKAIAVLNWLLELEE